MRIFINKPEDNSIMQKAIEKIEEEAEEEIIEEKSGLRKFFLMVGAILIAVLVMSYIFVTFPIGSIIEGQVESAAISGDVVIYGNISIAFENSTGDALKKDYFGQQKNEFSLCLLGNVEKNKNLTYHVKTFYRPETVSKSFSEVVFRPCSADTIILLHTHPYKSCLASEEDIRTLNESKKLNPDVIMAIMCEPERFSVYP